MVELYAMAGTGRRATQLRKQGDFELLLTEKDGHLMAGNLLPDGYGFYVLHLPSEDDI